jgi:hypothetical protein
MAPSMLSHFQVIPHKAALHRGHSPPSMIRQRSGSYLTLGHNNDA